MTVPARDVKVGWRVNPGTPQEWVVGSCARYGELWCLSEKPDGLMYMRIPPDQLVDAAPPPRMVTVPAMDNEALACARKIADYTTNPGSREPWPFATWLADAVAAHDQDAT